MLIRFHEISPLGSYYEIRKIDGFDESLGGAVPGLLEARCTLTRKGETKVEVQGRLKATLALTCDRCLASYDRDVDTEFQMLFEVASDCSWQVKDLEYKIPDLDTVVLDEPGIDLNDVVRQQLYLALPMKSLCSEQCRGMCSRCGANLNLAPCGCVEEHKQSPFAVLTQVKK